MQSASTRPPRCPAKPREYDLIRGIHAETSSLNATTRRVYGAKDRKTHAWTKQAREE